MRAARLARQSKASGLATKSISEKKYAHHLSFEIEHGHGKSTTSVPPEDSEGMQHRGGDHSKEGVAKIIAHKKAVMGNGSAGIVSSEVRRGLPITSMSLVGSSTCAAGSASASSMAAVRTSLATWRQA